MLLLHLLCISQAYQRRHSRSVLSATISCSALMPLPPADNGSRAPQIRRRRHFKGSLGAVRRDTSAIGPSAAPTQGILPE